MWIVDSVHADGEKAMGEEKVVFPSTGWTRPFWLRWGPQHISLIH